MNSHPPPRRAVNVGSLLLTPQENECLFGYLGRKCAVSSAVCLPLCRLELEQVRSAQVRLKNHVFPRPLGLIISIITYTLCSAVVQVYRAERSYKWVKRCCGVACLVKDNPQRSYFIRVFDIKVNLFMIQDPPSTCSSNNRFILSADKAVLEASTPDEGKTMFEQELYHNFSISSPRPYFITFAGDVSVRLFSSCQVGLNFASEEEAKRFRVAVSDLLNRRQRKTGEVLRLSPSCIALSRCDHSASNFKNLHPLPDVTEACWVVLLYKLFSFKHKLWNIVREEIPGLRLQNIRGCFRMQL
ncbi:hypothetical protein GOODEAATRI_021192 [Goodea atripinnis]|uniref:WH1 domain-containing protein n=1 Tax=Goodea atripinnis TaxID=208336 RepID=A0ABV0MJK8_9TELE